MTAGPSILPHVMLHVADILDLVPCQPQTVEVRGEVGRDVVQLGLTLHILLQVALTGADCPTGPGQ